jgi:hypothetical protein
MKPTRESPSVFSVSTAFRVQFGEDGSVPSTKYEFRRIP